MQINSMLTNFKKRRYGFDIEIYNNMFTFQKSYAPMTAPASPRTYAQVKNSMASVYGAVPEQENQQVNQYRQDSPDNVQDDSLSKLVTKHKHYEGKTATKVSLI